LQEFTVKKKAYSCQKRGKGTEKREKVERLGRYKP